MARRIVVRKMDEDADFEEFMKQFNNYLSLLLGVQYANSTDLIK
jgi:hypothetical protein